MKYEEKCKRLQLVVDDIRAALPTTPPVDEKDADEQIRSVYALARNAELDMFRLQYDIKIQAGRVEKALRDAYLDGIMKKVGKRKKKKK